MGLAPSLHVDTFTRDSLPPADQWPTFLLAPGYPDRLNCASVLLSGAAEDRPCLLTPAGEAWTYGDLRRHSDRVAGYLVGRGLVPGNRVLLRAPNNPWLVACWFGVLRMGGVAVTTMPLLRPVELQTIHEIARIDHSLVDDRFVDDLEAADIGSFTTFSALAALPAAEFSTVDTSADDVALLAFTSGTTGRPKATMHFHRDVLAIADTFSSHVLRPVPEDVFTGSPPLGFTFGLGGLVVFPMRVGASTLLLEKGTPDVLVQVLESMRPTVLFTAPTAYRALLSTGGDFSSLRRCVSAGEPLPLSTWEGWHEATGQRIIDGIGATELLHIFISAADGDIRPGATGRPVPGYEACVLDDAGLPVPDGEIGRLAVRGPTGCRYLADARQSSYVRNGWNLTGDTYIRDADGYFWYQARSDDMIISAGFNIAGPEVEMALLRHPDVLECGVVGRPDPSRTMSVHAYVVLRPDVTATPERAEELRAFTRTVIAPYKAPRTIEFLPALPRTSTGKVQRYVLRDLSAGGGGGAADAADAADGADLADRGTPGSP